MHVSLDFLSRKYDFRIVHYQYVFGSMPSNRMASLWLFFLVVLRVTPRFGVIMISIWSYVSYFLTLGLFSINMAFGLIFYFVSTLQVRIELMR